MGASFLFLALVFLGSSAAAGHSTYSADSLRLRMLMVQSAPGADYGIVPGGSAAVPPYRPGQPLLLNPSAGVCFTMRTYKVEPTGQWQDAFNGGVQGRSTCRMGSDYRVRTAVTPTLK